jgi:hypothetical protein
VPGEWGERAGRPGKPGLRGFGLRARVEALLEEAAETLTGEEHVVARTTRLEREHADEVVTGAVAARVTLGFREWPQPAHRPDCRRGLGRRPAPAVPGAAARLT